MSRYRTVSSYRSAQFILRRRREHEAQRQTMLWWSENCPRFGLSPRLLFSVGSYLGKPVSGFVVSRLFELGYLAEAPALTLATCGEEHGALFVWFLAPEGRPSAHVDAMQAELRAAGNACVTARTAADAILAIEDHVLARQRAGNG